MAPRRHTIQKSGHRGLGHPRQVPTPTSTASRRVRTQYSVLRWPRIAGPSSGLRRALFIHWPVAGLSQLLANFTRTAAAKRRRVVDAVTSGQMPMGRRLVTTTIIPIADEPSAVQQLIIRSRT
ncbi:hypothetical protein L227DRAFT_311357 [Lentinus tigrinus ALCF2SS1-6]|uniref:Uncharacterized protein n=1 Tax=Lentinus tigrinus ALCF2SS1-6 TaxID=1328759 RepID=A0A5C2RV75_9APHY|nr:hypothetical protein L227DRAFT_311357 [Lentinus tigrinus ALCF2SS1-6]